MKRLLLLALVLAGCGPYVGTIIAKEHEPPRPYLANVCTYIWVGKVMIPICHNEERIDDEDWVLSILDDQNNVHREEVTIDEYNSWNIGDRLQVGS